MPEFIDLAWLDDPVRVKDVEPVLRRFLALRYLTARHVDIQALSAEQMRAVAESLPDELVARALQMLRENKDLEVSFSNV